MTKKVLAVLLALTFILASFPMTAFAEGEENLGVTAVVTQGTEAAIFGKHSWYNYDEELQSWYVIQDVCAAIEPNITIYQDGVEIANYTYQEICEGALSITFGVVDELDNFVNIDDYQRTAPFAVGTENNLKVWIQGESIPGEVVIADFSFTFVENPVEKIEVRATKTLTQGVSGDSYPIYDEEGNETGETYFSYDIAQTEPEITVYYKSGDPQTYSWNEVEEATGAFMQFYVADSYERIDDWQRNNTFDVGTHKIKAIFMGVEAEYDFEIIEDPIESIEVSLTRDLVEYKDSELRMEWDESSGQEIEWVYYNCPTHILNITVNWSNGEDPSVFCENEEKNFGEQWVEVFGENAEMPNAWIVEQSYENQLEVGGTYTVGVSVFGKEATTEVTIVPHPIESIEFVSGAPELIENQTGWLDEETGCFIYDLFAVNPLITINYTDENTDSETISYSQLWERGMDVYEDLNPTGKEVLEVGEQVGILRIDGKDFEFAFKITEDPIESFELISTKPLTEFIGAQPIIKTDENGENVLDSNGNPVVISVYYPIYMTEPSLKINYKNGDTETLTFAQFSSDYYSDFSISSEELQYGENTFEVYVGSYDGTGFSVEYTFDFIENPKAVKSFAVTPKSTLIENLDAYYISEEDEPYYDYDLTLIKYDVTLTYEDGTTETFADVENGDFLNDIPIMIGLFENGGKLNSGKNDVLTVYADCASYTEIEVVENPYTSFEIIEKDGMFLEFTKADGTKEIYTVSGTFFGGGDTDKTKEYAEGIITTDKRNFIVTASFDVRPNINAPIKNLTLAIGDALDGATNYFAASNTIAESKYARIYADFTDMLVTFGDYKRNNSESFESFDGLTQENFDVMLKLGIAATIYQFDGCEVGEDENGIYSEVDLDIFKDAVSYIFDISNIDFTQSPNYNATANTYKVYLTEYDQGFVTIDSVTEKDGKYILNTTYDDTNGTEFPLIATFDSQLRLKSIVFTEASPEKITGVKLTGTKTGVTVTFNADEASESYDIYRSENGVDFNKVATVTETTYTDTTVKSGAVYIYKVCGVANSATGDFSDAVEINYYADVPAKVTGLKLVSSKSGVAVIFTKVEFATAYDVYRSVNGGDYVKVATVATTSYNDTAVTSATKYAYKVCAVNPVGAGDFSDAVEINYYAEVPAKVTGLKLVGTEGEITLTFTKVEFATAYDVYRSVNGSEFIKISTLTDTEYKDTAIESGNVYSYKISALNPLGNGEFSDIAEVKYFAAKPIVTGIDVENDVNGVAVSWAATENAEYYEVYRSENGGKYIKVGDSKEIKFVDITASSGKTYTYKVRGMNPEYVGDYSATKTINFIATPVFTVSRANTGYTIKWKAVTGATGYRVYVATKDAKGDWGSYKSLGDLKASVTSLAYKDIKNGASYKFTVRAFSGKVFSDYTSGAEVIYLATPSVKITLSSDGIKGSWGKINGAESYILYRSEFVNGKWSSWTKLGTTENLSFTDKSVKSGTQYKYTVKAAALTSESKYTASNTLLFLAEPSVKITNAEKGVTVKWSKVGGAKGYTVYRSELKSGKWTSWSNRGTAKADKFSWTDTKVASGKQYKYTVRAVNGKNLSTFTATSGLVYLKQPTVKISLSAAEIKATWGKVTGAESYTVYRSEFINGKWSSWETIKSVTTNSYTDSTVKSGVQYKYTVRAVNGKSLSSYKASNVLLFLAQPTTKITNAEKGIKVSWNLVDGATGYTVYRSELKSGKWTSWSNRGTAKADKSSWVDTKVTSGKQYKYTVRAVNGKSLSTYKSTSGLIFLATPTVKISNAATGVKVSWSKVSGATGYTVYRAELVDGAWTSWSNRGTAKANKSSWVDTKVTSGTQYKYTVRAINGKAKSDFVSTTALMFLSQPKVTTVKTDEGITVNWNASEGALNYNIYRAQYNAKTKKWSGWKNIKVEEGTVTSFVDSSAADGVTYKYTVRAVNEKTMSTYKASNTIKK